MQSRLNKILTPNDLGLNGNHQAGILIPKSKEYIDFFPSLESDKLNPFVIVKFLSDSEIWEFKFIYYNNKFFPSSSGKTGTRNEYRLTCMTKCLRAMNLKPGDTLVLEKSELTYSIKSKNSDSSIIKSENIWEVEFYE